MYAYSQTNIGWPTADSGSYIDDNLRVAQTQGDDSRAHYFQGDFDWIDRPTPDEIANAANWKLSGYQDISLDQATIETALAGGDPVVIMIPIYPSWDAYTGGLYNPPPEPSNRGLHSVTILGYDQTSVRVENSWGTGWGDKGWINIAWQWLTPSDHLLQAVAVYDMQRVQLPVNSAAPKIGGVAKIGSTLTESHGQWTNSPTSYKYQWQDGDSAGANFSDIAGATSQTYQVSTKDAGHTIRVEEWATNAGGTGGPAASAATTLVPPPPPVNSAAPTIGGLAQIGSTLTESHGQWTNSPTSYKYQWQDGDSAGANFSDIAGATSQTYQVSAKDAGHTIRVEEWGTNAGGAGGPAASAATSLVPPPPPPPLPTASTGGETNVGISTATITGTVNPQGSATGYRFEYGTSTGYGSSTGVGDAGSGTADVPVSAALIGLTPNMIYHYRVVALRGGSAAATGVDRRLTTGALPATTGAPAISGAPTPGSVLTCSPGTWRGASSYAYQWLRDDMPMSGQAFSTLTLAAGDVGHLIACRVTATNTYGSASATSAAAKVVQLAPPQLTKLKVSPKAFSALGAGPSIVTKGNYGTRVSFTLSERATVTFTIERAQAGRLVGGRCQKQTLKNRKAKACTFYVAVKGSFKWTGTQGANKFRFTGRLNGRKLPGGSYRLVALARVVHGNPAAAVRVTLAIR